eukprot:13184976-Alexandrium_andersonii.AAC.1
MQKKQGRGGGRPRSTPEALLNERYLSEEGGALEGAYLEGAGAAQKQELCWLPPVLVLAILAVAFAVLVGALARALALELGLAFWQALALTPAPVWLR